MGWVDSHYGVYIDEGDVDVELPSELSSTPRPRVGFGVYMSKSELVVVRLGTESESVDLVTTTVSNAK